MYNIQRIKCGNSSVVEHNLAKVGVASSSLVFRSIHLLDHSEAILHYGLFIFYNFFTYILKENVRNIAKIGLLWYAI